MHAVWVIFKKDARRLWWMAALAAALLAVLVRQDAYRADYYSDAIESWVDLVLPLVWACLIAQAMHGEMMLGDREFWMTRPYRRAPLLLSKLLFAIVFVHVPSFLGDLVIVAMRGLPIAASLPHLLVKQLMLAGAVTLPAMALAAVVRNLLQFVLIAVLVPVVVFSLYRPVQSGWISLTPGVPSLTQGDPVRVLRTILILAATGLAMVLLQGLARRGWWARGIGAVGALAASLLLLLTPAAYTLGREGPPKRDVQISMAMDARGLLPTFLMSVDRRVIGIPLDVTGIANAPFGLMLLRCDLVSANGLRIHDEIKPPGNATTGDFRAWLNLRPSTPSPQGTSSWGLLRMDLSRKAYDTIRDSPVTITGQAAVQFYAMGKPVVLPAGTSGDVPGLGRCTSITQDNTIGVSRFKVECESADGRPPSARIKVSWPDHHDWVGGTNVGGSWQAQRQPMLTPVERMQTSFNIDDYDQTTGFNRMWGIPREALSQLQVEITPTYITGYTIVNYQFSNIRLKDHELGPRPEQRNVVIQVR